MKKIVAVGIFFILALGLAGCNWFQPTEPTVEQPTVTEEPEETPTDVTEAEAYIYENTQFNFSLTFPTNWGKVEEEKSTQPIAEDIPSTFYTLTSEKDPQRSVQISIFSVEDKSSHWILDLPATLIEETDDHVFYFSSSGDCYGIPGCEDIKFKTILDESKKISNSFK